MSNQSVEEELKKAYELLEIGDVLTAKQVLADVLEYDLENKEIHFAHWCSSFWGEYISKITSTNAENIVDGLISKWKSFCSLLEREEEEKAIQPKVIYAIQKGVFSLALNASKELESQIKDISQTEKTKLSDIYTKLGLCYKKLGEYETALNYLVKANNLNSSLPSVLAEMADCFALCGEEKNAKVLFREAFFIDAQKVDIIFLESELIQCLIKQVKEKGFIGNALLEWIPVYGVLLGVFNVKRQVKPQEIGKLKQDIYAKENELKDPTNNKHILVPKLINMYFWLIDHYSRSNDGFVSNEIKNCELQIRVLDEEVYRLYKK